MSTTATVGANLRKELQYSQLSATKQPLPPMRSVPPIAGRLLPTMTVGSRPASMVISAIMEVEVVLPCVPARQTTLS